MVNLLELPLVRIRGPEDLDRYVAMSLVDANAVELPLKSGLPCVSIVDHHAVSGKLTADFIDIRPAVGATSTIYTEYLRDAPTRALEAGGLASRLAGVSEVRPQDRDAIGQAADFLIRRDGLKTVVTFALIEGTIDGSLRATDPAVDPALWIREAFGVGPLGRPHGGGQRGKGGFQIPLGPLATCPSHRDLWRVCKEMVESTICQRIGVAGARSDTPADTWP